MAFTWIGPDVLRRWYGEYRRTPLRDDDRPVNLGWHDQGNRKLSDSGQSLSAFSTPLAQGGTFAWPLLGSLQYQRQGEADASAREG